MFFSESQLCRGGRRTGLRGPAERPHTTALRGDTERVPELPTGSLLPLNFMHAGAGVSDR